MSTTILTLEEDTEEDFHSIGIVTQMESYKLAYQINEALGINLRRSSRDFDVRIGNELAYFDIFERENEEEDGFFYLIKILGRKRRKVDQHHPLNIFGQSDNERAVLIPNVKNMDYLLKFKSQRYPESEILRKLKTFPAVAIAYSINNPKITGHKNLIFN